MLFAIPAQAQVDRATLTGTVKDQLGAVIAGATVAVTHTGTNVTTRVRTTAEGVYLAPNLISGTYTVAGRGPGLRHAVARRDPGGRPAGARRLHAAVGGVSESVTVARRRACSTRRRPRWARSSTRTRCRKLPLAIRNWDDLLALVPGVQGDRYTEQGGGTVVGRTGGVNVHGARSLQNNFLLDGVDNNCISTTSRS